jgi:hypothetical protein
MPRQTCTIATIVLRTTVVAKEGPTMGNNIELLNIRPLAKEAIVITIGITMKDGIVPVDISNPTRKNYLLKLYMSFVVDQLDLDNYL